MFYPSLSGVYMFVLLSLVLVQGGVALCSGGMPAAAARRLEIARLSRELNQVQGEAYRSLRKRLNSLKREGVVDDGKETLRVATFYDFSPIENPSVLVDRVHEALEELGTVLGTVTVSSEGVNGALCCPAGAESSIEAALSDAGLYLSLNWAAEHTATSPFLALKVKQKKKALADGLDEPLDWNDCGEEIDPEMWHRALDKKQPIVLDVRNTYESDAGKFVGAKPLDTQTFAETWDKLDQALANVEPDQDVYMYCTGGIRCVKAGAFVKQKLGFKNVKRLKQGVVGYERWLQEQDAQSEQENGEMHTQSHFKGTNFVFDRRSLPTNKD